MICVIIPTCNAAKVLPGLLRALRRQTMPPDEIIVVDSESVDGTGELAKSFGALVTAVPANTFDHGGTRTLAAKIASGDILIFLTQDAMPADEQSLEQLTRPFFADEQIGAAYGRQLPNADASPFGAHLRMFNYPAASRVKTLEDRHALGMKTAALSNSFAAYRREALESIGWFKENMILGEDICAGAKLLIKGYKLAYAAEALVRHSHNYSCLQEFKRYFDIGVFHRNENWILSTFGGAAGEGGRYVASELSYIADRKLYHLIPHSLARNGCKFLGYHLGRHFSNLPLFLIKRCSMHVRWWDRKRP